MNLLEYAEGKESAIENIGLLLESLMKKNFRIKKYDIRFNPMHDSIAEYLLRAV